MLDSAIGLLPPVKEDEVLEMPAVSMYWPLSGDNTGLFEFL